MPPRLSPELIDRIRESTDIVDLISGYVQLERKGGNYFGLCPFHPEKTPSFSVHPGKGIFHCFGCGAGGNAFTFLQLHDKLSFAEAARELAQKCGIPLPEQSGVKLEKFDALYRANELAAQFFTRCLLDGKGEEYEAVRKYLQERAIGAELAKDFRLGYAPDRWDGLVKEAGRLSKQGVALQDFLQAGLLLQKENRPYDRFRGRLMFPIMNLSGKVVAFGGRTLKSEDAGAKYVNSPETPIYHKGSILYGLHQAREQVRRRGEGLVVEGYIDLMRLHEGGFVHSVATSGTALTPEQAQMLRRLCRRIILIFDGDAAGSHAALRGGDVLLGAGLDVRVVGLPADHDPDTFIRTEGAGGFAGLIEAATDAISYRIELYRREGRLHDAPSRAEVAQELLATLMQINDPIGREMAARQAASQIGLSAETMLRELLGRRAGLHRSGQQAAATTISADPFAKLPIKDRNLLEALIRWPELRAPTFAEFTAQEFQPGLLRRIAARLEEDWIGGRESRGEELISEETPLEDAAFISQALSQTEAEAEAGVDRKAMRRYIDYRSAQDCLRDLLSERLSGTYRKIARELEMGVPAEKRSKFTKALKEICERQKGVRTRAFWPLPVHPSLHFPQKEAGSPEDSTTTAF